MDKPSLQTSRAIAGTCRTATPAPLSRARYARCSSFPQGQDGCTAVQDGHGHGFFRFVASMREKRKKQQQVGDPRTIELTKLDVAAEHIRVAVRLFFEDAHPAPVYLLACSAREITTTIGDKLKINTVLTDLAAERGVSREDLIRDVHRFAGFMKHADRKIESSITFPYRSVEVALQLACHDFGRVAGGMPIEAQVYEVWIHTIAYRRISDAPLRHQERLRRCIAFFPGIRTADPKGRKKIGRAVLEKALKDPSLEMPFKRKVILPSQEHPSKQSIA
jgi:hypothetical protein